MRNPVSKTLVKDHKTINKKGEFPTKLVIPETKFTATLSKLGYPEIIIILDKENVNYLCVSIVQASDLKEILV